MTSTFVHMKRMTNYLIGMTFGRNAEMDVESFRDSVFDFADIDARYPLYIAQSLMKSHEYDEARFIANHYHLKRLCHTQSHRPNKSNQSHHHHHQEHTSSLYYQLPIPAEAIVFVDTIDAYRSSLSYLLSLADLSSNRMQNCVGVDAEWRPVFLPNARESVSILQFATVNRVYLIDMQSLGGRMQSQDWSLLKQFFESPNIRKITIGFDSDIAMLTQSFPQAFPCKSSLSLSSHVDLAKLVEAVWDSLRANGCDTVENSSGTMTLNPFSTLAPPKSVAELARMLLGRPVSKRVRMSNWNRRPLFQEQIDYAATDAYCLLDMYGELHNIISSEKLRIPSKVSQLRSEDLLHLPAPTEATNISVLVDPLLVDVGDHLKKIGLDVKMPDIDVDFQQMLVTADSESRTLITIRHHFKGYGSLGKKPSISMLGIPIATLQEQVDFLVDSLNIVDIVQDVQNIEVQVVNPVSSVTTKAIELKTKVTFDIVDENLSRASHQPIFKCICRFVEPSGNIIVSQGFARRKNCSKIRAALNMMIKMGFV